MKPLGLSGSISLPRSVTPSGETDRAKKGFKGTATLRAQIEILIEYTQTNIKRQEKTQEPDLGFWGAEATAKRILDFAKHLAGGDRSKIPLLRDAVIQGFEKAAAILGGLPVFPRKPTGWYYGRV